MMVLSNCVLFGAALGFLIAGTSGGMGCLNQLGDLVLLVVEVLKHLTSSWLSSLSSFAKDKHLRATFDHFLDWSFIVLVVLDHQHLITVHSGLVWNTDVIGCLSVVVHGDVVGTVCLTLILLLLHLLLLLH